MASAPPRLVMAFADSDPNRVLSLGDGAATPRRHRAWLELSGCGSLEAPGQLPVRWLLFVKRAATSWMSRKHFSREAVSSAHSVVDVRPLRRPTAEVAPRAAEPALDCLEPEFGDHDW